MLMIEVSVMGLILNNGINRSLLSHALYSLSETRKIQTWLAMAETAEAESASAPPTFLEIPTVVYDEIGQCEL